MEANTQAQIAGVHKWYNLVAENFSQRYTGLRGVFWKRFEEEVALGLLGRPGPRIMDMGCGPGRLAASLSALAQEVVGIDISEAMIEIASRLPHPANVHYLVMDATATTFEASSFDAVISLGMFEYLADPTPFLHEIYRLLKPGGRLVVTVHNRGGARFLWAWTIPSRLLRKLWGAVSPNQAAPTAATYFGYPVALRQWLWSEAWHTLQGMRQVLERQGFCQVDYRGFLFAPSTGLFEVASHVPVHAISRAGIAIACRLDHWLGGSPLTRNLSTLAMFVAQKPE